MAAAGEESLRALYRWVDAIPLSRPKRNMARDFSDAVLAAEVVKFHLPALVELHSYVPASSTQQKLANWGHLNRKVLSKLGARVPDDVIRKIVQCRPGLVEQVLVLLRQRIEERQRQQRQRGRPPPGPPEEPGARAAHGQDGRLDAGCSAKGKSRERAGPASPPAHRLRKGQHGAAQAAPGDTAAHLQPAETEQALLLARETIQILQAKVRRLEQLLRLKNIRIEDLSARLRAAQRPPGPHSPPAPS
ncbi:sperm flagellar protein 1 [Nothoprocta perdicaria]|uniref:sperm flagellar protein 1 n=1 Tax=Nothoprocta perdicaria TaxID=30464 RepID=UPI000E1C26DF|nr:sperm flagellar protein 1 [Nothoprocta perdicaria]